MNLQWPYLDPILFCIRKGIIYENLNTNIILCMIVVVM